MTSLAEDHVKLGAALARVVNRLVNVYAGRCSREQVEAAVEAARAALGPAAVEVFIAVLVERGARERLEAQLGRRDAPSPR
jgi:pyrimidine operon attenuation protein/uracil phosphoribosyltransferase